MPYRFTPYSFRSPCYAATSYTVTDLPLDTGGTFRGELYIEPDGSVGCEDWYVYEAVSESDDGQTYVIYNETNNTETFEALCRAVYSNARLCMAISDEARA